MANKDAAFGFRPVRHLTGGEIRTNEYKIAANYNTNIFTGQPVLAVTAGGIEVADDSSGTPSVILGIFAGCFFTDPTTGKPTFSAHYPASTNASDIVANVYDDPRIVFEVQHDGTGTNAMTFGGFDFVGKTGSTTTGRSTAELDTTTVTTSGQFKQIGISKDPDNSDTSSANVNAYVIPNTAEHSYLLQTALG
jgi:hypothetical protein